MLAVRGSELMFIDSTNIPSLRYSRVAIEQGYRSRCCGNRVRQISGEYDPD